MIAFPALFAQSPGISAERIRAHDRFLASDLLEGRGVGQRGGDAGAKLLALAGKNLDQLLAASDKQGFQPIPLDLTIRGRMHSKVRELNTGNVAAIVTGSDPQLKREVVVFSAH